MMIEEERSRASRAEDQATKLTAKAKSLRRQVEEAVSD